MYVRSDEAGLKISNSYARSSYMRSIPSALRIRRWAERGQGSPISMHTFRAERGPKPDKKSLPYILNLYFMLQNNYRPYALLYHWQLCILKLFDYISVYLSSPVEVYVGFQPLEPILAQTGLSFSNARFPGVEITEIWTMIARRKEEQKKKI